MIIRKRIWPRTLSDFFSMTFILTIIPVIYWFELWVVLPAMHEYGSLPYIFHFFLGNFIMLNIVGNFTYIVFCDTSTRRDIMSISAANTKDGWRLCASCETLAPPRSWHCSTCWKQNLKEVLGDRWYLTWILPYIKSQLPHNGIIWDTSNSWLYTNSKSK
ncbi:hypothetical protein QLX08_002627 [Tetragonisca angustula]|uniref:Uncharacterized protein n=2 Tax=Tetragonisca angustula TaxID=166442 RepID=A0AAW1AAA3_9HYME